MVDVTTWSACSAIQSSVISAVEDKRFLLSFGLFLAITRVAWALWAAVGTTCLTSPFREDWPGELSWVR